MKRGVIPGVNLARTVAPVVPANFLSRKHLFPLFETNMPGATIVAAPAGYGKTMLVAEWAHAQTRPTIWCAVDPNDSPQMFFAHIVQAVRNVLPKFGADFESERFLSPASYIDFMVREASEVKDDFNFVIDNGSSDAQEITPFAQGLVDSLPNNVHVVIVRRVTPATSLARYASLGNLSLITSQELKFSHDEIEIVCELNGLKSNDWQISKHLIKCNGWPAAIQMMAKNISRGVSESDFKFAETSNPLGILALESFNSLNDENKQNLMKVGIVEEFDLEAAAIILGEDFSESYVNKLAIDGMFVSVSSGFERSFKINPIIFEVLQELRSKKESAEKTTHEKLAQYYISKGVPAKALEHIFQSGNSEQITEILRISIRDMAAIGRGDQIIRWAQYGADDSPLGGLIKRTIEAVGHLVNLDFDRAESVAAELNYAASQDSQAEFVAQLAAMILAHVHFARGDFERARTMIRDALAKDYGVAGIENVDKIALLRLQADIAYIYDDEELVAASLLRAKELQDGSNQLITGYHIGCMTSMSLWCQGRFFEAAEFASVAVAQSDNNGFSGITAPLDALLVLARCQLELSQLDKAIDTLNLLEQKVESKRMWPWYFMAIGTRLRIQITQGRINHVVDEIAAQREKHKNLQTPNQLGWIIDVTDIFLRFVLNDWKRAEELLQRMPKIEMVRQIEMNIKFEADPKRIHALVAQMPETTPRERVNKILYQATINIDQENVALNYLRTALDLGAEVGFHEYFVRQNRLYPIMVKAAAAKPTIFIESVVYEMSERIKNSNSDTGALGEKLTNRELEILKHLTTGNPISAIAKQLHISQNTMKTHLRNVYRKLDVDGRHTAVDKAKKLLLI
ncbi:MAG: LuxR C-terminal-related transcriptional regulator [Actinobacteria bacterium]|nr:LuxR C-terminal-related transcriptional regulator [Actinomycetota bacterium]